MESFFEQHSWLLIVSIIVTVEGWLALKALVSRLLRRRLESNEGIPWLTN
jgi:hypothetical protein